MIRPKCSKEIKDDSILLADEQQVNLGRVNQVYVGESVHPLQARVDATVQLGKAKKKKKTKNKHTSIMVSFLQKQARQNDNNFNRNKSV